MKQEYIELLEKIPQATRRATLFGVEYIQVECNKRKAKNMLIALGWQVCKNPLYLNKGDAYLYDNKLMKYWHEPLA